jgi:GNAT superfamily N-acetyltransferase
MFALKELATDKPDYTFRLEDGLEIRVRRRRSEDVEPADLLEELQYGAPQGSAAAVRERVPRAELAGGARPEAAREVVGDAAWLAIADLPEQPDTVVGAARYGRVSTDVARLSVVVGASMQGRGIGSRLLNFVLNQARQDGICRIEASFPSSNRAAWHLLNYSPYHVSWDIRGSQVDVTIYLQAKLSDGVERTVISR